MRFENRRKGERGEKRKGEATTDGLGERSEEASGMKLGKRQCNSA